MTMTSHQMSDDTDRYTPALGAAFRESRDRGGGGDGYPNGEGAVAGAPVKPRLPSLDLETPTEPVFSEEAWLDQQGGRLADHPLLHALLMELPPKGTTPPPGWLDRWFEAVRSVLELLYGTDHR